MALFNTALHAKLGGNPYGYTEENVAVQLLALAYDRLHNRKPPVEPLADVLADVVDGLFQPDTARKIRDGEEYPIAIAVLRKAIDAAKPAEVDDAVARKAFMGSPIGLTADATAVAMGCLKRAGLRIIAGDGV